jgi:glycine/D-amino acid oxidase-like deaminating enzyme
LITFVPQPHLLDSPRGREWPRLPRAAATGRSAEPPGTADVVIVGAGPAGRAVAAALWHRGVDDLVLLDRDPGPCKRFFGRIDVLGQRVLRSPYEHHPGVEGFRDCELMDFARLHWALLTPVERNEIRMAQAGHRSVVPVDVFEAYCEHLAASHHVTERCFRAEVDELRPVAGGVVVRTGTGSIRARFVVLCAGEERTSAPADWFGPRGRPVNVSYWDEPVPDSSGALVVVGAGLTAAHLVRFGLVAGREVHWVLRESRERYQCADVNSTFFRPEGRSRFGNVGWADRLELMRQYRRASIMFEFRPWFAAAEESGQLVMHRGRRVVRISAGSGGRSAVAPADGRSVVGDAVKLAIGTTPVSGDAFLPAELVGMRDGWPDLDEHSLAYRRAPRVFAVGAAAGMVLGPAARNIDGHRFATARVAAVVSEGLGLRKLERVVAHVRG